jgi:hypothetical protein
MFGRCPDELLRNTPVVYVKQKYQDEQVTVLYTGETKNLQRRYSPVEREKICYVEETSAVDTTRRIREAQLAYELREAGFVVDGGR